MSSEQDRARAIRLACAGPPLPSEVVDQLRNLLPPVQQKYFTDMGPMVWHQPELPEIEAVEPEPTDAQGALVSLLKKMRGDQDGQDAEGS